MDKATPSNRLFGKISVKPAFLLRKIIPNQLNQKYDKGEVLQNLLLNKEKINFVKLYSARGNSSTDPSFTFKNRDNIQLTIATTNNKPVQFCRHCIRHFTTTPVGIPILLKDTTIYTVRNYCDYNCALAGIKQENHLIPSLRKPYFFHSEELLRFLFHLSYGEDNELTPAADPDLAEWNGGPLSLEEYKDVSYTYVALDNLVISPAKEQFLRRSNKSP